MDNYYKSCPPTFSDARGLTDYRASQVREEMFKYDHSILSENQARTFRINNGEKLMNTEWVNTRRANSCHPQKVNFHTNPRTLVTTEYNNAEILAYNGKIMAPKTDPSIYNMNNDYRLTYTHINRDTIMDDRLDSTGYSEQRRPHYYSGTKLHEKHLHM